MEESEIRKKLEKSKKKILKNSRKLNEELDRLKLEEVKKITKEIEDIFPGGISEEISAKIKGIIAKYQKKNDDAIQKLIEMNTQKQIIELSNISINDESYWPKISAAMDLGIPVLGIEESTKRPLGRKRIKSKDKTK